MPNLFDPIERTDGSPAWPAEDSYSLLDRAAGPVWDRQRQLLDGWYQAFPDENDDLRRRFQEADPRQHYAAWWELYVHALLRALGFEVTVHPQVPGTDGRPDFLAERRDSAFYVEAATVFSGIVSPSRQSRALVDIEDTIARLDSSMFWVSLRVDRVGGQCHPSVRSVRRSTLGQQTWIRTKWLRPTSPMKAHGHNSNSATGLSLFVQEAGIGPLRPAG